MNTLTSLIVDDNIIQMEKIPQQKQFKQLQ